MKILNQTKTTELQLSNLDLDLGRLVSSKMRVTDAKGNASTENILVYEPLISRANNEIKSLKQLLKNTDYKAIKFAEGELSADEYEGVKMKRRAWRARINELEEFIRKEQA